MPQSKERSTPATELTIPPQSQVRGPLRGKLRGPSGVVVLNLVLKVVPHVFATTTTKPYIRYYQSYTYQRELIMLFKIQGEILGLIATLRLTQNVRPVICKIASANRQKPNDHQFAVAATSRLTGRLQVQFELLLQLQIKNHETDRPLTFKFAAVSCPHPLALYLSFIFFRSSPPGCDHTYSGQGKVVYISRKRNVASISMSAILNSPVADIRGSFGAAYIGLLVSTTLVLLPWVFFTCFLLSS